MGLVVVFLNLLVLSPKKVQKGVELLRQSSPPSLAWKQELKALIGADVGRHVIDTDPDFLIVLGTVDRIEPHLVLKAGNAEIEIVTSPETEYQRIVGTNLASARRASMVEITKGASLIVRLVAANGKYVAKYIQIQQ